MKEIKIYKAARNKIVNLSFSLLAFKKTDSLLLNFYYFSIKINNRLYVTEHNNKNAKSI